MKVYIQVVDTRNGISQNGMIEESIQKGFEVANALEHFGVTITTVEWISDNCDENYHHKFGRVKNTSKVVSVIVII